MSEEIKTEEIKIEEEKPKKRKKITCLDLDDCVFDFLGTLLHFYNEKNGTCVTEFDLKTWDFGGIVVKDAKGNEIKGEDIRKFFKEIEDHGLYAFCPVFLPAKQAITMLNEWGYKVIFITSRDPKYQKTTELALAINNIPYYKLIFNWDKCKVINELSEKFEVIGFCDDKLSTVEAVKEKCNLKFNFVASKAHNKDSELKEGIIRVNNLLEMLRYL